MTTTINSEERVFAIFGHSKINPILCNLADVETTYRRLVPVTKIQHLWNGKFTRMSRRELKEMLKVHKLDYSFL